MPPDTLFLRFDDAAAALEILSETGIAPWLTENSGERLPDDGDLDGLRYVLSVVGGDGIVRKPTGATVTDPGTGEAWPLTAPMPGYHVNILIGGIVPEALAAWAVSPDHPAEDFAILRAGTEQTQL